MRIQSWSYLDTVEVIGSIPVAPNELKAVSSALSLGFFVGCGQGADLGPPEERFHVLPSIHFGVHFCFICRPKYLLFSLHMYSWISSSGRNVSGSVMDHGFV
jgi:hypothetical protein